MEKYIILDFHIQAFCQSGMAKRKKGAIVGTVDSDSDNEIEIDISATMNIQEHSAHISHK